jgi:hypothetical protein
MGGSFQVHEDLGIQRFGVGYPSRRGNVKWRLEDGGRTEGVGNSTPQQIRGGIGAGEFPNSAGTRSGGVGLILEDRVNFTIASQATYFYVN